jgi:hypothetical protein
MKDCVLGNKSRVSCTVGYASLRAMARIDKDWNPVSEIACRRRGPPVETSRTKEKVLLPEVEDAIKRIDEQIDMMDREEAIRTRWSHKAMTAKER